jgi:hypothetical protein
MDPMKSYRGYCWGLAAMSKFWQPQNGISEAHFEEDDPAPDG